MRPGSSCVDVVFAPLMRRILARRTELIPGRTEPQIAWDGVYSFDAVCCERAAEQDPLCFGGLVWADDLATPFVSPEPHSLLAKVAVEAGALAGAFSEHAMELAFGPLKTAAVMALRGAGSRSAKIQAFGRHPQTATSSLTVLRENYPPCQLPTVESYRHLGSFQCFNGSLRQEIHQRVGQTWGAFREGRRKLYKNKLVHPARRCELLCSLAVTKLFVCWYVAPLAAGGIQGGEGCFFTGRAGPPCVLRVMIRGCMCARSGLDWLSIRPLHCCMLPG